MSRNPPVLGVLLLATLTGLSLRAQEFTLSEPRTLPEPKPELPVYSYAPDGHYTVLREGESLLMFWPGHDSFRTSGA